MGASSIAKWHVSEIAVAPFSPQKKNVRWISPRLAVIGCVERIVTRTSTMCATGNTSTLVGTQTESQPTIGQRRHAGEGETRKTGPKKRRDAVHKDQTRQRRRRENRRHSSRQGSRSRSESGSSQAGLQSFRLRVVSKQPRGVTKRCAEPVRVVVGRSVCEGRC